MSEKRQPFITSPFLFVRPDWELLTVLQTSSCFLSSCWFLYKWKKSFLLYFIKETPTHPSTLLLIAFPLKSLIPALWNSLLLKPKLLPVYFSIFTLIISDVNIILISMSQINFDFVKDRNHLLSLYFNKHLIIHCK